jgi:hypothetical protein
VTTSPRSGGGTSGRDFHARAFNPGRWQIITAGGAGIGMLDVEYRPAEIYLVGDGHLQAEVARAL